MFATVRPTPRRYPHRLRPGSDPVRHPATALDQPRHADARSSGAPPPTSPSQRRSAALGLPITRPSALRSGPIGLHHGPGDHLADRPAARRAAHGRSPRRLATAQGPPAPHPATPAQFPPAHQARGPIATHTIDGFSDFGFWVLDWILELKNWAGGLVREPGQAEAVGDPWLSGNRAMGPAKSRRAAGIRY